MRRKMIKAIAVVSILAAVSGAVGANAKQPYCIDEVATAAPMSDLTDEAAPTDEPTAEPTAEPVQETETTPDPLAPLYWQQEATRQEQAEANGTTHSLLGDIKGLLGGLFGRQENTNTPSGNAGSNANTGSNANSSGSSNNGVVNASGNTASSQDAQMAEMFAALFENMELITPEPTQEPKKTATDGNGYIIEDKQLLDNGKEFLTMSSKDGTEFYMVIDRDKDNEV